MGWKMLSTVPASAHQMLRAAPKAGTATVSADFAKRPSASRPPVKRAEKGERGFQVLLQTWSLQVLGCGEGLVRKGSWKDREGEAEWTVGKQVGTEDCGKPTSPNNGEVTEIVPKTFA